MKYLILLVILGACSPSYVIRTPKDVEQRKQERAEAHKRYMEEFQRSYERGW